MKYLDFFYGIYKYIVMTNLTDNQLQKLEKCRKHGVSPHCAYVFIFKNKKRYKDFLNIYNDKIFTKMYRCFK